MGAEEQFAKYPIWDLKLPPYPERSRYFSLAPVGIGTADVESFTSYLIRLASLQRVSPHFILFDAFKQEYGDNQVLRWAGLFSKLLNGLSYAATETNQLIKKLIPGPAVTLMTLLPLDHVISNARLIRTKKVWCILCLVGQKKKYGFCYEKLIWNLAIVEVCSIHKLPLVNHCISCDESSMGFPKMPFGRCNSCEQWIEGTEEKRRKYLRAISRRAITPKMKWVDIELRKIIGSISGAREFFTQVNVRETIRALIEIYEYGDLGKFSLHSKIVEAEVVELLEGNTLISVNQLLNICFAKKISPDEMLSGKLFTAILSQHPNLNLSSPVDWKGRMRERINFNAEHLSEDRLKEAEAYMSAALNEDPPAGFHVISRRLSISKTILMKYLPELSIQIKKRFAKYQKGRLHLRWNSISTRSD